MAMVVGELVAFLRMNDKDFHAKVGKATSAWKGLGSGIASGAKAMANALGLAAGTTTTLATNLLRAGSAYNVLQQNSRAALRSILGSAEAANAQMDKLDDFARNSPFSKSVFIEAQQQLLGFGIEAERVIPILDGIQQSVAATGGGSQQLGELAFIIAQIGAAGKVTGQDLLQFGQRGVNAAEIVGEAMGVTAAEFREMVTKGKVDANEFITLLTDGLAARFSGATANVKKEWSGALDRMKAASRDIGSKLAQPFIDPHGGGRAVGWGNQVADILRQVEKHVARFRDGAVSTFGATFTRITRGLDALKDKAAALDLSGMWKGLSGLREYAPLIGTLSGAIAGTNLQLLAGIPLLGGFVSGLTPLTLGIAGLVASTPELRQGLQGVWEQLAPARRELGDAGRQAAKLGVELVGKLTPALVDLLSAAARVAVSLAPLAGTFVDMLQAGLPLVDVAASLAESVAKLPTPVLAAGAAMLLFTKAIPAAAIISGLVSGMNLAAGAVLRFGAAASAAGGASLLSKALAGLGVAARGAVAWLRSVAVAMGPIGWAVTGLTLVFGAWAASVSEANEKAERHRELVEQLGDSFEKSTGAITANTRALLEKKLAEADISAQLKELGVGQQVFIDSLLGQAEAQEKVRAAIAATKTTAEGAYNTQGQMLTRYSDAANKVGAVQAELGSAVKDAKAAHEANAAAQERNAGTAENLAKRLRDVQDAQEAVTGATRSADAALDRQAELMERATELVEEYGQQAANAEGRFGIDTKGGREANALLRDMAANYDALVGSMQKAGASGETIRSQASQMRAEFIQTATALGATTEQAEALASQYLRLPSEIKTDVELDIQAALQSTSELVTEIDEQKGTVEIHGNPVPGNKTLGELVGEIDSSTGTVSIRGDDYPATMTVEEWVRATNGKYGTTTIYANSDPAERGAHVLIGVINGLSGTVTINARDHASWGINAVKAALWALPSYKEIVIRTTQVGSVGVGPRATPYADGGYHTPRRHRFAANGLAPASRQAMFARAGSWITWAEDETHGEYYIPASILKRRRSTELLAQAARHFGYDLVPLGARRYAAGGSAPTPQGLPAGREGLDPGLLASALMQALAGTSLLLRTEGGGSFEAYIDARAEAHHQERRSLTGR